MPEALSPELLDLRRRVVELTDELAPLEAELADVEAPVPAEIAARVRERSRELGLFALPHPEELGGSGAGPLALVVVREALAAANLRLGRYVLGPDPGVLARAEGGLRQRYLQPLLRGDKQGAFAFTEPRDAAEPTTGHREGDDLVVRGRKAYVTGGREADFLVVLMRSPELAIESGEGASSTVVAIVDREVPGLEVEREFRSLDGSHHVSFRFDDVRVPVDRIVGAVGEGMKRALAVIGNVRLRVAAEASGLALWIVEHTTGHLQAPHRSGAPLGKREGVRLRYADMRIEAYAARAMLYRTARLVETGEDSRNEVMATKVFTSEVVGRLADAAIQLVGGNSLVAGHPLEQVYRQVRTLRLAEGSSDLLRLNLAKGRLDHDSGRL